MQVIQTHFILPQTKHKQYYIHKNFDNIFIMY